MFFFRKRAKAIRINDVIKDVLSLDERIEVTKKDDGVDYFGELLGGLTHPAHHMEEVTDKKGFRWCMRHDVDHDLDVSLYLGLAEKQRGLKSTYFLLTPNSYPYERNYYGWVENGKIFHDKNLLPKCRLLLDMGHRIGLHNDMVSLALRLKRNPADMIYDEVEFFAKNGLELTGTAAHGNPLCRELAYNNRELFEGCIRVGRQYGRTVEYEGFTVQLHSLKLEDFGFQYEAYSLPRNSRLSESGRKWGGRCNGIQINKDELNKSATLGSDLIELVKGVDSAKGNHSFQILTHPDHWKAKLPDGREIVGGIKKHG